MENKVFQYESINKKKYAVDNPLVSIITPVLNRIKYLEECIQSVLTQSYPYIEHIFVDGGSTDGTLDMLTSYQIKYPDRIRLISEPDKNAEEAWNKGLRMAKGEILGLLGSDDISEPDAIMTVVEFFRANPDAYFVYGDCNLINERGEVTSKAIAWDFDLDEAINDNSCIPGTSAFFKREVIEKIGLMDTSLHASDLDYWIRAGKVFRLYRIEKVLSNFRQHEDSFSSSGSIATAKILTREHLIISRRHGGRLFSPIARRYYRLVIVDGLRPILGRFYPFIRKVLRLLRLG